MLKFNGRSPEGPCQQAPSNPAGYAELDCKTNFSFLRGASHPEELVDRAVELGYAALAVTDRNTLAGVVRMHVAAKARGLRLVVGARIVPTDAPPIAVYPTDRTAYGRLARLITRGRLRTPKGECDIRFDDVAEYAPGLIGIVHDQPVNADLLRYGEIFGDRLYLGAAALRNEDDAQHLARLHTLSRRVNIPMVAGNDVHYHEPDRRFLQDVLTCIREHCTIEQAGRRLFPNAERYLKTPQEMARLFADYPEAIARTLEVASRCAFSLDELRYDYPEELCPPGCTPMQYLAELTWAGAGERYPAGVPPKVRGLLEHELRLIEELKYESYFLTVWDIVRFARSRRILCQGRGSAANSAVCYCLGVTSVDPDRIGLLFERFVSRERNEPPDIDVDFEHERREEVFQYIYHKYGRERAGIVAEVITYRSRSAVRDVGKALGLSLDRVDAIAKSLEWWSGEPLPADRLRDAGIDPDERIIRCLTSLVRQIVGFPRHLSQHVGGFVITRSPLCEIVPLENGAMPGRTFIEWDKDDIDALGILKVDCLSLGMLTAIRKCFDMLNGEDRGIENGELRIENESLGSEKLEVRNGKTAVIANGAAKRFLTSHFSLLTCPFPLALHTVPPEDQLVYDMICAADTVGVFQIESRAQMSMLPRLRPRCFYDLVIEVAIVRPGPIQGQMVHPYLRRRNGEEQVSYPTPDIEGVLKKTLGVPLFQEQAMQLAIVAAGFTPGEADQLRRSMGAWRRSGEIEKFRTKLISGMQARGLSSEFAERVFEQIRGFGAYGFPESHAASFALLVYVSAWLKCYYPAAYCAALLNSQPMGFYAPAQLVRDARHHGVEVRPVDVNYSSYDCILESAATREGGERIPLRVACPRLRGHVNDPHGHASVAMPPGRALRLGMRLVKGISRWQVEGIELARRQGPFATVDDLVRRSGVARRTLAHLAAADAFRSLGLNRREALWAVLGGPEPAGDDLPLLASLESPEPRPALPVQSLAEHVAQDYHTVGMSLTAHPMSLLRESLESRGIISARQLRAKSAGAGVKVAGLVLVRQRPGTASGTLFYTLEDETGMANLIVRPQVYERCRRAARGAVAVLAEGRVERQGEVIHVQTERITDLSKYAARLQVRSRDFH